MSALGPKWVPSPHVAIRVILVDDSSQIQFGYETDEI
jgi:hypothetical protein